MIDNREIKQIYLSAERANSEGDGNYAERLIVDELFLNGHIKQLIDRVEFLQQNNRNLIEQIDVTQKRNIRLEEIIKEIQ